jgi:hypothetical protein
MQAYYLDTLIDRQNHATSLHDSHPLHRDPVRRQRGVLENMDFPQLELIRLRPNQNEGRPRLASEVLNGDRKSYFFFFLPEGVMGSPGEYNQRNKPVSIRMKLTNS